MGKGARSAAPSEKEVLIEGQLYDVSDFRHPGGSIVKFLTGNGDATDAFQEFHGRSKKAAKMLKSLPHRDVTAEVSKKRSHNGREALAKGYAEFRAELKAEGFFNPVVSEVAYRHAEVLAMHLIGAWLILCTSYVKAGVVMLGLVSGRCGWLMHEGGHYSLTGVIKVDMFLQEMLYGVGCGMSAAWWRNQHNKHHATPQKLKHDVDLDTLPLMAFNAKIAAKAKGPMKLWLKLQGALFIPVSCLLVALGWQIYLHPRHSFRTGRYRELGFMALRQMLAFGVVLKDFSWPAAVGTYLCYDWLAASYIFTNFSLSHTHLPVSEADDYLHWVEYAAKHTTNIAPGPICNWWMANLNFQVEHHLFPSMPQCNHKIISPRVKAFLEKHDLVYDVRPYFTCLGQTLFNLHQVGNEQHSVKVN
ncbi:fatty acid desaturase-domain-containing protein [Pelagophyceae sp. CCMP2097]|nr:fatty acid desaturase-domain-containing protein [Pelagophyceae sp. CCMP2097]